MRLFAALVPPRDVLDQRLAAGGRRLRGAGAGAGRRAGPSPPRPPRRAVRQAVRPPHATRDLVELAPAGQDTAPPAEPTGPLLDLVPPVRMHVPIVKFGNLALDVSRTAHRRPGGPAASGWQSPRLHLHGGVALEPKGDHSVWVRLGGDLDELNAVVRDVYRVAQGLQLFVDRRVFRTDLQLGTINERTTEAHIERCWPRSRLTRARPGGRRPCRCSSPSTSARTRRRTGSTARSRWAPRCHTDVGQRARGANRSSGSAGGSSRRRFSRMTLSSCSSGIGRCIR